MSDLSTDNNPTPNNSFDAVNNIHEKVESKKEPKKSSNKVPVVPIAIIFISIVVLTLAALKWHHDGKLFSNTEAPKKEVEKSPYENTYSDTTTTSATIADTTKADTMEVAKPIEQKPVEEPAKLKQPEKIVEQKPAEEPKKPTDLFGKEMNNMPTTFDGYLAAIANPSVDYDARFSFSDSYIASYFTASAIAIQVDEKGNEINKMNVDEFLGVLRVNEFKIKIKDKQMYGGKVNSLKFMYQF